MPVRLGAALVLAALLGGCTTPLELGERRYREGDRLGALEIWRGVKPNATYYPKVHRRIQAVEQEFRQLVVRYKKRAVYYEQKGRLAESILNYRLALKLEPDDHDTLGHVQELARTLAARKREAKRALYDDLEAGRLAAARDHLDALRTLDPFDSELESVSRQVDDALDMQVEQLLAKGRRGFSSGNYGSARAAFEEVLTLDAQNESARGYLSYIDAIRAEESRPGPKTAEVEPRLVRASDQEIRAEGYHQNALAAERAGDPYASIRDEVRALELSPQHADARRHLTEVRARLTPEVPRLIEEGRNHYQQEELHSALDAWRRVLLIDPGNAEARDYVARAENLLQNLERLRAEPGAGVGSR
jgi:tetratricopeptide (TPR) repeat protein